MLFTRLGLLTRRSTIFRNIYISSCRSISLDLKGVFPPIPTPFNTDETIAYDRLKQNFSKWNEIPFRGYLVQGSNGEYVYLTVDERVEMVKQTRKLIPEEKLLIAGSGCESTKATTELSKRMADVGADAALIVTPSYYKGRMNNDAQMAYYSQVADKSPIPIILYSFPGNTGIDLASEVIIKLATHPNIIGIKDSGGDIAKIGLLVSKTSHLDFQVLAGSASVFLQALSIGSIGVMAALANVLGQKVCDVEKLFYAGNMKTATALQQQLIEPNAAVTKTFGIAGLKLAMDWFGYYGGLPRKPLMPLTQSETDVLKQIFKENKFL